VRIHRSLVAGAALAVVTTALAMVPAVAPTAMADPITSSGKAVVPRSFDIVGVGSDTIENVLDQLSIAYNSSHKTHNSTHPFIYSWNATPPSDPTNITSQIVPKAGCKKVLRPDGSSAGIAALASSPKVNGQNCFNFARSSRARGATDPALGKGGVAFVTLGQDAVTFSTSNTSNAPKNLTTAQLKAIYTCTVAGKNGHPRNDWADLGGKPGHIDPVLPQLSSGTRSFFLTTIGGGTAITPGSCVDKTRPEENEGIAPVFKRHPLNVIFPFSIGKYLAQKFHSAACLHAGCTGNPQCKPTRSQNRFGCDEVGNLRLRMINGTNPTVGTGAAQTINAKFTASFLRFVFDVVPFATSTPTHIPAAMERFFNPAHAKIPGFFCGKTAQGILKNYGFLPVSSCGSIS
jgi:ABC-type phosphate transport system substrate-binding protein